MSKRLFKPGIQVLLDSHLPWISGKRVGLLSHPAALDSQGATSASRLRACRGVRLVALFGPEHGFFGGAGAGEPVPSRRHPVWLIPVHSLYGDRRRPAADMLKGIDVLVADLQDLGIRCYTFCATLRYMLEAAAKASIPVVVADRPVPLPSAVDGPCPAPGWDSFVAAIPAPLAYAMTPAETALWLKDTLALDIDLRIAAMASYERESHRRPDWPPWISPSPGIRSWESAACYPITVFAEALPAIDFGRNSALPFQVLGAPWMRSEAVIDMLGEYDLPGVAFHSHVHPGRAASGARLLLDAVRIVVTNPRDCRPAFTAIAILSVLQTLYGRRRLWNSPGARSAFFDKLFGTPAVREALQDGEGPETIAKRWRPDLAAFGASRCRALLYPDP